MSATEEDASREALLFDLTFPGGNALEYIEAIRKQSAGIANIVAVEGVYEIDLPEVELRQVSVETAIYLLDDRKQTVDRTEILLDIEKISGQPRRRMNRIRSRDFFESQAGEAIFHVRLLRGEPQPEVTPSAQENIKVWPITDLLSEGIAADDLLSAIEASFALQDDDQSPPTVRFHKETDLILVRGSFRARYT